MVSRLPIFQRSGSVLIFVGTKNASEELSNNLNLNGFSSKLIHINNITKRFNFLIKALALHGDKQQYERDEIMRDYKSQKVPILVATDVVGSFIRFFLFFFLLFVYFLLL